jgi:hypothetical protein
MSISGVEHIHIMNSGKSLEETFPRVVKSDMPITTVIFLTDEETMTSRDPQRSEARDAVKRAIVKIEKLSEALQIESHRIILKEVTLPELRDRIFDLKKDHPNAKLYFNLTGGKRAISIWLFMLSWWLEGRAYYIDEVTEEIMDLNVPKIPLSEISKNPNYQTVLRIIYEWKSSKKSSTQGWDRMPYSILYEKFQSEYIPVRTGVHEKDKMRGTLTKLINPLYEWGFVETGFIGESRKNKYVRLTQDGEFAYRFLQTSCSEDNKNDS